MTLSIRSTRSGDEALILKFIRGLAEYEHLSHEVEVSEADLKRDLFGVTPRVFCEIAEWDSAPAGFALWFYNYSTFRGRHGIYLEDLYIDPAFRGRGIGKALLVNLARRCVAEGLGRLEWWVLDWNTPSIEFYKSQGARLMEDWTVCRVDGTALAALGGGEA
jgi:GNAT superfamily N-acetyltransferase